MCVCVFNYCAIRKDIEWEISFFSFIAFFLFDSFRFESIEPNFVIRIHLTSFDSLESCHFYIVVVLCSSLSLSNVSAKWTTMRQLVSLYQPPEMLTPPSSFPSVLMIEHDISCQFSALIYHNHILILNYY